ncbi:cytosol aminopeptidase [Pelobates cultripes]|uniref:Cytosol aminopeptidase n=1 Tax=Pelobates cultripes TaxID=61616 RepID=A0AAD1SEA7_PELCU|nr:cytosol aminopeptidase [Pelobates cultripes]
MLSLRAALQRGVNWNCCRGFSVSHQAYHPGKKGLVLGVYETEKEEENFKFTNAGDSFDKVVSGKLRDQLTRSGPSLKKGKTRMFYGLHEDFPSVLVVGLGKKSAGIDHLENWNESKENIRTAVSVGCRQMQDLEVVQVEVDSCGDAQAAAEGAVLGLFEYDELKKKKKKVVATQLYQSQDQASWQKGVLYAEGQNLARYLMEAPANYMTPTKFAEILEQKLGAFKDNVRVFTRTKPWIEEQQMGAFLSVAKGSDEPPVFLEIHYQGSTDSSQSPLVFVGKGVTFDSGGISLKPSSGMDAMRADMGGAATVCSAILTAATLKLPLNIIGLAALCENMPNGRANKPGDVVKAKNGKTIQVDNTDAEGRLLLADALCYAHNFNPRAIVNAATLTGAMDVALGSAATGVFTNSSWLWTHLQEASIVTGDRVWRMPLFDHYSKQVTESTLADLNNVGKYSRSAGACTAAAFLKEFVTAPHWAHLDIAGVMSNKDEVPYLRKGMAGRPTRTLIEFASRLSNDKNTT